MAHYLPSLVVAPIMDRLRHETQNVILTGEEDLRRYLEERRRAGMRLGVQRGLLRVRTFGQSSGW